jgi:FkbM family methyltransferase
MKILWVMRHSGYVRNFESVLRMLCTRGHRVYLAFQSKTKYEQLDPTDIARQLSDEYPYFSSGEIQLRADGWGLLGREVRLGLDYLRYLGSEYDEAPKLRERARREAPSYVLERAEHGALANPVGRRLIATCLRTIDRAIPRDAEIDAFLRKARPDVLAVTPLIEPGSPQAEYLRSARALGIRTAFCVASWDNLTNKGLIHGPVDLVTVWNDAMKREAVERHGVPAERVAVTGAAAFDHWFDWRPRVTREEFCARVGLPAGRPYVLYVCSSKFVAPEEVPFVRRWVQQIRQSASPMLREAGILVRPHPQNAEQWEHVDLNDPGVVIWPRAGAAPVDHDTRGDYFESMFYSAAVVGINTTAEIEGAILGRPVHALLTPEFRDTQEGTLHFHHLRRVNGGLLHVARSFDEHLGQLDQALRGDARTVDEQSTRFVDAFVRPYGRDVAATPKFVEALEALAEAPARAPEREPAWASLLRPRLAPWIARLEEQAQAERQARTARQAEKDAREGRRRVREAEQRARFDEKVVREEARRAGRAQLRAEREPKLESLVADFRRLNDTKKTLFLRTVGDGIPADALIAVHAMLQPQKLDYDQADIYLKVTTKSENFRLRACAKEPFTIDWIHRHVGAGDVLYDIGANIGVYSLVAAKKPGGPARVFSFEASYASIAALCTNIAVNDVTAHVTPLPVALSDRTAMNVFNLRDLEPGAARHTLGDDEPLDGPAVFQQPVMMFRLDDVVDRFGLPLPNHIKLDVDGGELAVLDGASRTLASPTLRSLLVEVSSSLSAAVTDVLGRHGLHLEWRTSVRNKAGEYEVWYGLFARGGEDVAIAGAHVTEDVVG